MSLAGIIPEVDKIMVPLEGREATQLWKGKTEVPAEDGKIPFTDEKTA